MCMWNVVFLQSDAAATFYSLLVLCSYYSRVFIIRGWHTQPFSPAVSHGNDSYNTNSPSASVVTVVRNHSHTWARAAFTSCGYCSRVTFIAFKSFELCGYYSSAATIQGRLLFKGSYYSRAATIQGWLLFKDGYYSRAATIGGHQADRIFCL